MTEPDPLAIAKLLYGDEPTADEIDRLIEQGNPEPADSFAHAHWCNVMARASQARADQQAAEIDDLIHRLRFKRAELVDPHEARAGYWHKRVEGWHRKALVDKDDPTGKTVKFPTGGESKLRASQPVRLADPNHEELGAWLAKAGHNADKVYKPVPDLNERFLVSELYKLAGRPKTADREEGDIISLVDNEGQEIPGLKFRVTGDRWEGN